MPARGLRRVRSVTRRSPGNSRRAKLNVWKVLGVAFRKSNLGLAMRALGAGRQVRGIKRAHIVFRGGQKLPKRMTVGRR